MTFITAENAKFISGNAAAVKAEQDRAQHLEDLNARISEAAMAGKRSACSAGALDPVIRAMLIRYGYSVSEEHGEFTLTTISW